MKKVLEKVRKGKPRIQKSAKPIKPSTPRADSKGGGHFWSSGVKKKSKPGKSKEEKKPLLDEK